jgi:hypothetical protein
MCMSFKLQRLQKAYRLTGTKSEYNYLVTNLENLGKFHGNTMFMRLCLLVRNTYHRYRQELALAERSISVLASATASSS